MELRRRGDTSPPLEVGEASREEAVEELPGEGWASSAQEPMAEAVGVGYMLE